MNPFPLPADYRIFLLTVWRDDGVAAEGALLRFSLDDPRSGQRRGFGEPASLLAFLEDSVSIAEESEAENPGPSHDNGGEVS